MPDTPNKIDARSGQEPAQGSPDIPTIPFRMAVFVWLKISLLSFGGPAGQIAVMHRLLVDELKWVSERRFLDALNFCMLLPGPEAQQLTIYLGWLLHRVRGGVVAGLLFILPGAVTVLALSMAYVHYQQAPAMGAAFFGIKAAVLAIVLSAVWRLSRRVLHQRLLLVIALASFLSSFVFGVPFPLVVAGAALAGYLFSGSGEGTGDAPDDAVLEDGMTGMRPVDRIVSRHQRPSWQKSLLVLMICGGIWLVPLFGLFLVLGPSHIFTQQGLFFSQVAVVSFGGAYAVLAYMAQQAVSHYGWLTPSEMLDGLGMAETTPGPLIMVTQFVGFLGGYRNPGLFDPMLAGTIGAAVTTWVTFAPCFLWIFLGAPYIESLRSNRALARALSGITAAVVGVVLSLAIWFGLQVLFTAMADPTALGPLASMISMRLPVLSSFDPAAAVISMLSLLAIVVFQSGVITVIAASAAAGLLASAAGLV
jgi:chromate transporter